MITISSPAEDDDRNIGGRSVYDTPERMPRSYADLLALFEAAPVAE